jgi:hypothetical protein
LTATINLKFTGSDAEVPILFVDGDQAATIYTEPSTGLAVARIESPGCPSCNSMMSGGTLMVNPQDGDHRYYRCPICGVFSRWEVQPNKTSVRLDTDWRVFSGKTTELDVDFDVPKWIE